MTLRLVSTRWRWLVSSPEDAEAIDRAAIVWAGTPHRAGQSTPGVDGGVDCVHFDVAVLYAMYDELTPEGAAALGDAGPLPRVAQDSGLHCHRTAARTLQWFKRRFPHERVPVRSAEEVLGAARPGDVLMVKLTPAGRPNHTGIVASSGRAVWHAGAEGVVLQALGDMAFARRVARIYRPLAPVEVA